MKDRAKLLAKLGEASMAYQTAILGLEKAVRAGDGRRVTTAIRRVDKAARAFNKAIREHRKAGQQDIRPYVIDDDIQTNTTQK